MSSISTTMRFTPPSAVSHSHLSSPRRPSTKFFYPRKTNTMIVRGVGPILATTAQDDEGDKLKTFDSLKKKHTEVVAEWIEHNKNYHITLRKLIEMEQKADGADVEKLEGLKLYENMEQKNPQRKKKAWEILESEMKALKRGIVE